MFAEVSFVRRFPSAAVAELQQQQPWVEMNILVEARDLFEGSSCPGKLWQDPTESFGASRSMISATVQRATFNPSNRNLLCTVNEGFFFFYFSALAAVQHPSQPGIHPAPQASSSGAHSKSMLADWGKSLSFSQSWASSLFVQHKNYTWLFLDMLFIWENE